MHLLELFAGTGSIGKAARARGHRVTSVDLDPAFEPTICCDVLDLSPEDLERPDAVWASPPCTHFSRARTNAKTPRDLEGSDALVRKARELAEFWGVPFLLENPEDLLVGRAVVAGLPMARVDYCMHKDERWPMNYRKRTCLWGVPAFCPRRPLCNRRCLGCDERGVHKDHAQGGGGFKTADLYRMPPLLCEEIVEHFEAAVEA